MELSQLQVVLVCVCFRDIPWTNIKCALNMQIVHLVAALERAQIHRICCPLLPLLLLLLFMLFLLMLLLLLLLLLFILQLLYLLLINF